MAIVTAGAGRLNIRKLGFNYDGTIEEATPTHVRVVGPNGDYTDFDGSFTYPGDGTFSGLVNSITSVRAGEVYFTVTDANADAETLYGLIKPNNTFDAAKYLLDDADQITGGDQRDALYGFDGDDTINGGAGDDKIIGGDGADMLTGGAGADMFRYGREDVSTVDASARDTITDFSSADGDKIDLSKIDANIRDQGSDDTPKVNDAFTFVSDFTFEAGQLRAVFDAGSGGYLVQGDTDGNGEADFSILVMSATAPTATDFIL